MQAVSKAKGKQIGKQPCQFALPMCYYETGGAVYFGCVSKHLLQYSPSTKGKFALSSPVSRVLQSLPLYCLRGRRASKQETQPPQTAPPVCFMVPHWKDGAGVWVWQEIDLYDKINFVQAMQRIKLR